MVLSELLNEVMKMIGVCSELGRLRINAAVSKPSMQGMETSRRMVAKSMFRRWRSASLPERALTMFWPRDERIASRASNLSARSSTSKIFAFGGSHERETPFSEGPDAFMTWDGSLEGLPLPVCEAGACGREAGVPEPG